MVLNYSISPAGFCMSIFDGIEVIIADILLVSLFTKSLYSTIY